MMQMIITREELVRALHDLDRLEKRGFPASKAILKVASAGDSIMDTKAVYSDHLIMQAEEDNPRTNWGNIASQMIDWYRFENGQLINE